MVAETGDVRPKGGRLRAASAYDPVSELGRRSRWILRRLGVWPALPMSAPGGRESRASAAPEREVGAVVRAYVIRV